MDTITHALAGYAIVKSGLDKDTGRWGTLAGVSASIFPDVDLVLRLFVGTEFTIRYHRYLTNSLFLIVPFSLLFAWLFVKVSKVRKFWSFFFIWVVEILAHTFLDLVTSFGTMILSPLSNHRFTLDWVFIIDLFLVLILLLPMIASWFWREKSQTLARISIISAALYIVLCACNHLWALSLTKAYAREKGLNAQKVASIPQPLSPFHWGNFILTREKIYEGRVNLMGSGRPNPMPNGNFFTRILTRYPPIRYAQYKSWDRYQESPWVEKALALDGVQAFLWFARFPVAQYKGVVDTYHRVTLFDLRYGALEDRRPFLYVVDFDEKGNVIHQGFIKRKLPFFKKE